MDALYFGAICTLRRICGKVKRHVYSWREFGNYIGLSTGSRRYTYVTKEVSFESSRAVWWGAVPEHLYDRFPLSGYIKEFAECDGIGREEMHTLLHWDCNLANRYNGLLRSGSSDIIQASSSLLVLECD